MSTASINLWGTTIGYVSMDKNERFARFEYDPHFAGQGISLAPLKMPLRSKYIYRFPDLDPQYFYGLPGLLADSLPDKYGNSLINIWLARQGRRTEDFNAVDRLCYTGIRGMSALEFEPSTTLKNVKKDKALEVKELVELASMAFASKNTLDTRFDEEHGKEALLDILRVSTSAGGARAKAVIAYNPATNDVRSGQLDLPDGFEHWLIKFDGVKFDNEWGVVDPVGYGLLEYSYYLTALKCDITMMESRLFRENGRNHFMTRRFDRDNKGNKFFVQTLGALTHYDYSLSGHYSYEQLFQCMKKLNMTKEMMEEQFRRVVFNLVGCNQDDHVKNFSFMMDRTGIWSPSPAYDLCHSEGSEFTRYHQLSLNGKRTNFNISDIKALGEYVGIPRGRYKNIIQKTTEAFSEWKVEARELEIPMALQDHVLRTLRLEW